MAAMPFSSSLHGFLQTKVKPSSFPSSLWHSSIAIPSIITSLGSSKSAIFQHGLSLQSSTFSGFPLKSRSFAVNARAATEKNIYDFTVKVRVLEKNSLSSDSPQPPPFPGASRSASNCYGGFRILTIPRWFPRSRCWVVVSGATEFGKECVKMHGVCSYASWLLMQDIDGKDVSLGKFKGKVLLIVNVASKCGLTSSNYSELSHIYEKYKTQGFEILAFPCNQFGGQEPGSNPEIKQFACTRFKAEFPIFDKVDVNGPDTAPVYQFLKSNAGGFLGDLVKWNFEKFLVDKNGKVAERYPPTTSPFQIEGVEIDIDCNSYGLSFTPLS
ncbi:putative glutathione peroxidase 7, chloroplastic [Morella rubra]|uniref:Glutathione peroxidase n=1 Tax=Morella rubra TaxID=262757 RepID=A0A6A1V9E0_9ROSI|nr:putative glutathione peroxidase 7, chloroplastic [Morella rubra]